MECLGSALTNKYAEGLPGDRYYGGNEFIDQVRQLAQFPLAWLVPRSLTCAVCRLRGWPKHGLWLLTDSLRTSGA